MTYTTKLKYPITDESTVLVPTNPVPAQFQLSLPTYITITDNANKEYTQCVAVNLDGSLTVIRNIIGAGSYPFAAGACLTDEIDNELLEFIICQSECVSGSTALVGDSFITVDPITNGYRLSFEGYIEGAGVNINGRYLAADVYNTSLAPSVLGGTDVIYVGQGMQTYHTTLTDLSSYIINQLPASQTGASTKAGTGLVDQGTVSAPKIGMPQLLGSTTTMPGLTFDTYGRLVAYDPQSFPSATTPITPDGVFPYATVTVQGGQVVSVSANTFNGVSSVSTTSPITNTGTPANPNIGLTQQVGVAGTQAGITYNEFGIVTARSPYLGNYPITSATPIIHTIVNQGGTDYVEISHQNSGIAAGVYSGITVDEKGHVISITDSDSVIVKAGYGIEVTESPTNTFNVLNDGVVMVVAGDNISVDSSNPQAPVIHARLDGAMMSTKETVTVTGSDTPTSSTGTIDGYTVMDLSNTVGNLTTSGGTKLTFDSVANSITTNVNGDLTVTLRVKGDPSIEATIGVNNSSYKDFVKLRTHQTANDIENYVTINIPNLSTGTVLRAFARDTLGGTAIASCGIQVSIDER